MFECRDQMQRELKRLGYSWVRLPRADIRPLLLVGIEGSNRTVLGHLKDGWSHDDTAITQESGPVTEVRVTTTSRMRASLGMKFLAPAFNLFKADTPQLRSAYKGAHQIQVEFVSPQYVRRNAIQIGGVLTSQDPTENLVLDSYLLMPGRRLWVITEVLQSTTISVRTFDASGAEFDVAGMPVQAIGQAGGGLSASRTSQGVIAYQGTQPITFAFKGLELIVDDGQLTPRGVKPGSHLGPNAKPPEGDPIDEDNNGPVDLAF